ncbi:MAG: tail fiber domain-containing protein [Bacteroidales bacterium]|nr:tail fiber domain-containing protein [Bacteroidales bacterium]
MKKLILTLCIILFGGGILFAQTSALKITSSAVQVNKKITSGGNLTLSPSGDIVFDFQGCDLSIFNGNAGSSSIVMSMPSQSKNETSAAVVAPNYGAILPEKANFMDLGSATNYFRYSYVSQPYHKTASKSFSDARYKKNIKDLSAASHIIQQLRPVSFDFIQTEPNEDTASLKDKVGFIAQEMIEVLPHLVGQLPGTDIYAVDYTSVIPYLVKAFQEAQEEKAALEEQTTDLQEQVSELQNQIADLQEIVQSLLVQNETVSAVPQGNAPKHSPKKTIQEAKLFQNLPNPFSENTLIRYELPKTAGNAYLQVFDMSGRMLQNIQLPHQEVGQVEISAGELTPGAYTYSLIVSGKVVDSKRMVVTQ